MSTSNVPGVDAPAPPPTVTRSTGDLVRAAVAVAHRVGEGTRGAGGVRHGMELQAGELRHHEGGAGEQHRAAASFADQPLAAAGDGGYRKGEGVPIRVRGRREMERLKVPRRSR